MIDNVYELKQRFVGFNKVKLLTVVFYCMTYSWCSFLTEYNAMEDQEEHKENEIHIENNERRKEEKEGKWRVEGDAVVYTDGLVKITYRWNINFGVFIDLQHKALFARNDIYFPVGYDVASKLVGFLYRHQGALGIYVKREVEYRKVKRSELPGCCQSCCNGKLGDEALKRLYTEEKKNGLAERILLIGPRTGESSNEAREQWIAHVGEISESDPLELKKIKLLVVIASLFDQDKVGVYGQSQLFLSGKVKKLIHSSPGYGNVSFEDVWSLEDVIVVAKEPVKKEDSQ